MAILKNIDIDIDIDKAIYIDIDKISNRFKFGISNRATQSVGTFFNTLNDLLLLVLGANLVVYWVSVRLCYNMLQCVQLCQIVLQYIIRWRSG